MQIHPSRGSILGTVLICAALACGLLALFGPGTGQRRPATAAARRSVEEAIRSGFPSLAPALAPEARLSSDSRTVDGRPVVGWSAEPVLVPPPGLQAAEQAAWLARTQRQGMVGVKPFFPNNYTDPVVVEGGGVRVSLLALGAAHVTAQTDQGKVVYRDAYPQTDIIHAISPERSEEFMLLHTADAPRRFEYEISSGDSVAQVELENGGLRFTDGQGKGLRIEPPYVVDASGTRSSSAVRWELGSERADNKRSLTLLMDPAGLTYPLVIDPSWSTTGSMGAGRGYHSATLLPNGKVLVAGGVAYSGTLNLAELFDPITGTWSSTSNMLEVHYDHTATMLPSGKVLVVGGGTSGAELYDSATGGWSSAGSMSRARFFHTATLLNSGKVLVAGGFSGGVVDATAELYDPIAGTWSATINLTVARRFHTATLLGGSVSSKVLFAGGQSLAAGGDLSSAELYDPASGALGAFSATGSLTGGSTRYNHTATLLNTGLVLLAGGIGSNTFGSSELYTVGSGTFAATATLLSTRQNHSATIQPDGQVLVAGGTDAAGTTYRVTAEYFDPAGNAGAGQWNSAPSLAAARAFQSMTMLPNGTILVAGGQNGSSSYLTSSEIYNVASATATFDSTRNSGNTIINMVTSRSYQTSTLLPNGTVLIAGGENGGGALTNCELFDPVAKSWTATGNLGGGASWTREFHTATLLPNGKVLVTGGAGSDSNTPNTAELFNSGSWVGTGGMATNRQYHVATLLTNGTVLVTGGRDGSTYRTSTEVYDPTSETWPLGSNMATARAFHSATLLNSGKVLVAGGQNGNGSFVSSAEIYDPITTSWSTTGSLATVRANHTATLLPNGKVLVAGGSNNITNVAASAELYDPGTGLWSTAGSMATARAYHTATLLPTGKVLIAGGGTTSGGFNSAELYDPIGNSWSVTATLVTARRNHTATLLPNGRVLLAGGLDEVI